MCKRSVKESLALCELYLPTLKDVPSCRILYSNGRTLTTVYHVLVSCILACSVSYIIHDGHEFI